MAVKGEFGLALGRHYRGRERNPGWAKSPAPMDATAAGWTDLARCTFGRAVLRFVTQARVGRSGVGRDDSRSVVEDPRSRSHVAAEGRNH